MLCLRQQLGLDAIEAFHESINEVCEPFSNVEPHVKLMVLFAVLTIVGQVFVLVSHHSTYTIWFYEVKIAHLQSKQAAWQRRSEAGRDFIEAKRRVEAQHIKRMKIEQAELEEQEKHRTYSVQPGISTAYYEKARRNIREREEARLRFEEKAARKQAEARAAAQIKGSPLHSESKVKFASEGASDGEAEDEESLDSRLERMVSGEIVFDPAELPKRKPGPARLRASI